MRPLPIIPRGPRRPPACRPRLLLTCPRLSPQWQLSALHALIKPNARTKGPFLSQAGVAPPLQSWPATAAPEVRATCAAITDRLGFTPAIRWLAEGSNDELSTASIEDPGGEDPGGENHGDYWLLIEVPGTEKSAGLALALLLSRRLPEAWFVFDRLFLKAGQFHRRQRGHKLNLTPASNVHLPRAIRATLRGLL